MGKTSMKLNFTVIFFIITTGMLLTMPGADARAPARCPRMIDCNSVCQGFPYKCVDGKCICGWRGYSPVTGFNPAIN
ncbi:hypothetical protein SADUNF_Sadunf10G0101700 [Salix dunnii]|uniref:Uncharacterized protein n=1 Tax=Salix dunnii TaxID=1413687 RepID=A0A835JN43_9ROSI|nr:hypothetical protein SADUNF_Sadunf10G0101700 [Salix dunnii]